MKGIRGPKGVYVVLSATKKCKEIGGKMYKGLCLKSSNLEYNADNPPLACTTYVPNTLWNFQDVRRIEDLFKTVNYM